MPSSTIEQYIKTIYSLQPKISDQMVQMSRLAEAMGVTPGTATSMVKHMSSQELVNYQPRKGVRLSDKGSRLAVGIIRRHRLIETFLERVLGYDWSEVHGDAEILEHAVSERFIERIDELLGNPQFDPHGDPIPTADGRIRRRKTVPLADCSQDDSILVLRLRDRDSDFLRLMKEHYVTPGEHFRITERNEIAGTLTVEHSGEGGEFTIGIEQAGAILVAHD